MSLNSNVKKNCNWIDYPFKKHLKNNFSLKSAKCFLNINYNEVFNCNLDFKFEISGMYLL